METVVPQNSINDRCVSPSIAEQSVNVKQDLMRNVLGLSSSLQMLLVMLFAFVIRFVVAFYVPLASDELLTLQSAKFIQEENCWPVYRLGQDYMLAIDEVFYGISLHFLSNDQLAIRVFPCAMSAIGIGLLWGLLKTCNSRKGSEIALLPFIIPNSSLWMYSASAIGTYSLSIFLIALIVYCTVWIRNGTPGTRFIGALLLALFGGFCLSVWRALLFFLVLSLPLVLTKTQWRQGLQILSELSSFWPSRLLISLIVIANTGIFYRYFTRPTTYVMGHYDHLLLGVAAISFLSLLWCQRTSLVALLRLSALPLGIASCWLVFGSLVNILFGFQKDKIYSSDTVLYHVGYSLHHAHDWLHSIGLLLSRVIPSLWKGRIWSLEGGVVDSLSSADFFIAITVGLLLFGAYFHLLFGTENKLTAGNLSPEGMMIVASTMMCVFLTPSYQNFGDYSFRYLVPFFPGLLLLLDNLVLLLRSIWVRYFIFIGFAIYNVVDLTIWVMRF